MVDKPKLAENSPLDRLAGSRNSVASVSSDSGILEAFPLPDGIVQPGSENARPGDDDVRDLPFPTEPESPISDEPTNHRVENLQKDALDTGAASRSEAPKPSIPRAQLWYLRYGHQYGKSGSYSQATSTQQQHPDNASFGATPQRSQRPDSLYKSLGQNAPHGYDQNEYHQHGNSVQVGQNVYGHQYGNSMQPAVGRSFDTSDMYRPQLGRTHSVSRSWDAGSQYTFPPAYPPTSNFTPLSSWQDHVQAGSHLLADNDSVSAKMHWLSAASSPWNNELARLLLQLGINENWFPDQAGPVPDLSAVDPQSMRRYTAPITGMLGEALTNYAARLKIMQMDHESLRCFELAGELGSKDAVVSAAQIYFKGTRRIKRDISKAQRLFKRANDI